MLYQRSLTIERRLQAVLRLVRTGGYSTPKIAQELCVSIPTISRAVLALRGRGHNILAEKAADGWRYVLAPVTPRTKRSLRGGLSEAQHTL